MFTLLFIIFLFGLIYFIAAIVKTAVDKSEGNEDAYVLPAKWLALGISLVSLFIYMFLYQVHGQEVGVIQTPSGIRSDILKAGTWNVVPPWYTIHRMDKTVWVYTFTTRADEGNKPHSDAIWAPTKDGIKMGLDISVYWAIDPEQAPWIYSNVSEQDGIANAR